MRTQTCLCIHMILPKRPNFILSIFASIFISNTSILDLLSYVYALELLFHMFNCLFAFHMLELGFICDFFFFFFLISSTRIHMFMHDVIGVELLQVIHQYKHAFYWWNMFVWWLMSCLKAQNICDYLCLFAMPIFLPCFVVVLNDVICIITWW